MKHLFLILLCLGMFFSLKGQDSVYTVKMMHYNLLKFGDCEGAQNSDKYSWLGNILSDFQPDILTVNEMFPAVPFANGIAQLSFSYSNSIKFANFTNFSGGSLANQLFYNSDLFGLKSNSVLNSNSIRDINIYELYFKPGISGSDTTFLYVLDTHYKAGSSSSDRAERLDSSVDIMNWIKANGAGKNIILAGDLNVGSAGEGAFQELVNRRPVGETLVDPLNLLNSWSGPAFASAMTQSTRTFSSDCGVNGGMDDRFDFILPNEAVMNDSFGVGYKAGSYAAFGNDGDDYNTELDCNSNSTVGTNVCLSLRLMSDHLPVIMELEMDGFKPATALSPTLNLQLTTSLDSRGLGLEIKNQPMETYQLDLLNLHGQMLLRESLLPGQKGFWAVPNLKKGVYYLRITDRQGRSTSRKLMLK